MSGPLFLLDTNIVLTLVRGNALATFIDGKFGLRASKVRPMISVVTHGEVRVLAGRNGWGDKHHACAWRCCRRSASTIDPTAPSTK